MAKTMKIQMSIEDEQGNIIVEKTTKRSVPYIEEIENQGFRSAFHDLETTVLEARKEDCDDAVGKYLETVSLKKQEQQ